MTFRHQQFLWLLFTLALTLMLQTFSGVQATTNAVKAAEPKGFTISGQVEHWNYGEQVLRAEITDGDKKIPIAESTIATDGYFTIKLPLSGKGLTAGLKSWSSQSCKDFYASNDIPVLEVSGPGFTLTPDPLDQAYVELRAYQDVNDPDSAILIQQRHDTADSWGYTGYEFSKSAGVFKGRCAGTYAQSESHDEGETFVTTINQSYVAGWNTELFSFYETETGTRRIFSVAPAPASFTWDFFDE